MKIAHEHAAMRIEELIERLESDRARHIIDRGSTEEELTELEESLQQPLPGPYRFFLARLGGGVYYLRHEVFGARRVMTHDIEMVPDLLSFKDWLGAKVPPLWLPVHRGEGRIHTVALGVPDPAPVRPLDGIGASYPDFTALLEVLVTPP
jgi:hypothetical protein